MQEKQFIQKHNYICDYTVVWISDIANCLNAVWTVVAVECRTGALSKVQPIAHTYFCCKTDVSCNLFFWEHEICFLNRMSNNSYFGHEILQYYATAAAL